MFVRVSGMSIKNYFMIGDLRILWFNEINYLINFIHIQEIGNFDSRSHSRQKFFFSRIRFKIY
jgi:hypothetical protein